MNPQPPLPVWAESIRRNYLCGEASLFILHLNVFNQVLYEDRYYSLTAFGSQDPVLLCECAPGSRSGDPGPLEPLWDAAQIEFPRDRTALSEPLVGLSNADLEAVCLLAHNLAGQAGGPVTPAVFA